MREHSPATSERSTRLLSPRAHGIASLSLDAVGIWAGDKVPAPTITLIAKAEVGTYLGARRVLVDICPQTLNIDPQDAALKVTPRTRAIISVHLAGRPAIRKRSGRWPKFTICTSLKIPPMQCPQRVRGSVLERVLSSDICSLHPPHRRFRRPEAFKQADLR